MFTFVDVVGVDAVLSLHQRTVLLRLTVEQEAVIFPWMFVGVEHHHIALCSFESTETRVMYDACMILTS